MSSRSTCRCSCSAAVGIEFFSVCLLSARCSSLVARRSSLVAVCPTLSLTHTRCTLPLARSPGGYTKTNVARAWTLGTAAIVDEDPDNELPESRYRNFFGPENSLRWVSIRISTDTPTLTLAPLVRQVQPTGAVPRPQHERRPGWYSGEDPGQPQAAVSSAGGQPRGSPPRRVHPARHRPRQRGDRAQQAHPVRAEPLCTVPAMRRERAG